MEHTDAHDAPTHDPAMWSQQFWDDRYAGAPVWSGDPNPLLVRHAADLPPGTALDVGCGEGADVLWLAARGWTATGVDVSRVVLDRCAGLAAEAGPEVAARTRWEQVDVLTWAPPEAAYDLVSAQFLHLAPDVRPQVHRRLAAAVRPGGTLLVVAHSPQDHDTVRRDHPRDLFATAGEMAEVLDPAQWEVETAAPARQGRVPGGELTTLVDEVLRAVRR